ncbi:hypothetical protein PCE1_004296 [Barthelona sp. PCE]
MTEFSHENPKAQKIEDFPNHFYTNPDPNIDYIFGIDEAGRGPILGPMVYGIMVIPVSFQEELKGMGVYDSKQLDASVRERIFSRIVDAGVIYFDTKSIGALELSHAMQVDRVNLNKVALLATQELVQRALDKGFNLVSGYVDTVGDPLKWRKDLNEFHPLIDYTVESKADERYPVTGGASIVAKVTRDKWMENYQQTMPGYSRLNMLPKCSGYASDERTVEMLKAAMHPLMGYPSDLVRTSWGGQGQDLEKLSGFKLSLPETTGTDKNTIFSIFKPQCRLLKKRKEVLIHPLQTL